MYTAREMFRSSALLSVFSMMIFCNSAVLAAQGGGTGGDGKPKSVISADGLWDKDGATTVALTGAGARISGDGAAFSGRTLTIRQAGTYVLSGKLENGQVLIDTGKNDTVRLVLNGVSLHNETGPAIYAPKSKEIILILEKGVQNTVSDGLHYAVSKDDNANAAIFVQDNLSIAGDGVLTVTGRNKHGIRSQDFLTITGGVISVDSAGDALRGRDGVVISGGSFTLKSGGDGIYSNNDKDDAKGFVTIAGGAFTINAKNDGIQARTSLTISGGAFQITTGGGSAGAPARMNNSRGGFGGGRGFGPAPKPVTVASVSKKGLKAGKLIHVTGGDFVIDAEDDAVHSNDKIIIAGGKFTVRTGDDGFHANTALEISGGDINIISSYEGIESISITISGGNIKVYASDDAVNAADGTANTFGRGPWGGGGRFSINENMFVRITGGTLDLHGGSDGIDSNGNIFIEGGTIKISGPSLVMDGAIDLDGSLIVSGGELITAGSIQDVSQNSTQPVILLSHARQHPSGSVIEIKDSNGKVLLDYTSRVAFYMSGFSSPSFKIGGTYSLFINGEKQTDIKLNTIVTRISDTGGAYNGGRGFGGRGRW